MELVVGSIIHALRWEQIRINNWSDAEITRIDGDTVECRPLYQVDLDGKPLSPFSLHRAQLDVLVAGGTFEVVRVIDASK